MSYAYSGNPEFNPRAHRLQSLCEAAVADEVPYRVKSRRSRLKHSLSKRMVRKRQGHGYNFHQIPMKKSLKELAKLLLVK